MNDKTYNGWSNYETWLVNLWLTNDQGTADDLLVIMATIESEYECKEAIKTYVEEIVLTDNLTGFQTDLIRATLDECDFYEILRNNTENPT